MNRHNRVRNLVARFCDEGLLAPVIELRDLLSNSGHRPGDVTIPNWSGGRPLAVDVAVTSPFLSLVCVLLNLLMLTVTCTSTHDTTSSSVVSPCCLRPWYLKPQVV